MDDRHGPPHEVRVEDRDGAGHAAELVPFLRAMPAAFCLLDERLAVPLPQREAAVRLLDGSRGADCSATSLWDALPGLRGSVFEQSYRAAVATGEPVAFEATLPGATGGWFEVRAWPAPDGLAVYLLDVTDRRRAEDAARRAAARAALLAEVQRRARRRPGHRVGARPAGPAGRAHARRRLHRHRRRPGGPGPRRRLLARRPGAAGR